MHSFRSDNNAGLCPEALAALAAANDGSHVVGYGDDAVTARPCPGRDAGAADPGERGKHRARVAEPQVGAKERLQRGHPAGDHVGPQPVEHNDDNLVDLFHALVLSRVDVLISGRTVARIHPATAPYVTRSASPDLGNNWKSFGEIANP